MLRFKSLGSGSSGNATVIEAGGPASFRLLVDCGLGIRVLEHRLTHAGLAISDLDAIFITHEHGDHVGCAPKLALRHGIPIWMSEGTWRGCGEPELGRLLRVATDGEPIDLGSLELIPIAVPHDAQEPLQLRCTDGASSIGILTDLGHVPDNVQSRLQGCDALLLECNHDIDLLEESPYPVFLKRRVAGDQGHLSNAQAAAVAAQMGRNLKHVLAAHLSRQNNRPELAEKALRSALSGSVVIDVAHASTGSDWIKL